MMLRRAFVPALPMQTTRGASKLTAVDIAANIRGFGA
jgi:hypothetical protein